MQESVTKGVPTPCTEEMFLAALNDKDVKKITERIAGLDPNDSKYSDKKNALKRKLPIIIPHSFAFVKEVAQTESDAFVKATPDSALFTPQGGYDHCVCPTGNASLVSVGDPKEIVGGGKRSSQNAVPSGLAMLDVDNVASPRDVYTMQVEPFVEGLKIYFAAITPSGHGLRLIFERQRGESIQDAMMRIASACDFEEIDAVTYDLARASYMVPQDYVLYMNSQGLFSFPDEETEAYWLGQAPGQTNNEQGMQHAAEEPNEVEVSCAVERNEAGEAMFKGVRYADIVKTLIERSGGEPTNGERNTYYFGLAKQVRYICDFNASLVCEVLPDFGLAEEERRGECERACKAVRKTFTPQEVLTAVSITQMAKQQDDSDLLKETSDTLPMPKLPRLLQIICRRLPEDFRPAMIIAALPVLGALATRVRFNYLDMQEHSFSFFSCIVSPAATGKSFIRKPIDLLLTPINEQDAIERQKDQEYKEKLRTTKNAKMQPEDPHACPRNNGINVSIAKLLQLLTYSEEKHLIGIGEEMDTLLKSEKAGAWSQKSDIYRLAFDNAEYGQNYMSDNSFSTKVKVYYNLLLSGTPNAMSRFFSDLEDGLVTRVAFAKLPDMRYAKMPIFPPYKEAETIEVLQWARALDAESGTIRCKVVEDAIEKWVEEKRVLCDAADSLSGDIFRRRAAVMGFRAGMMAYLLEGKAERRSVAEFAVWVAEYVFRNQMELWGDKVDMQNQPQENTGKGDVQSLLELLPANFTTSDLVSLRAKRGQSTTAASIKQVLRRWRNAGVIAHTSTNQWQKTGNTF